MSARILLLLCVLIQSAGAEAPTEADRLHYAGALLGDRVKLEKAWNLAPVPDVAASLTNSWLFETEYDRDEELLGTPPFLEVLTRWEEKEPNNGLVPCLREMFRAKRGSRLHSWKRLKEDINWKERLNFHYAPLRRATLTFLLDQRGNTVKNWIRWLGYSPLQNVGRITRLVQSCLLEARFLAFTGEKERAQQLLQLAEKLATMIDSPAQEILLRKHSILGGVIQNRIVLALDAGTADGVDALITQFRGHVTSQQEIMSRLAVLTTLHEDLSFVYAREYGNIRELDWEDVASVCPRTMAQFAQAYADAGGMAVDRFWTYRTTEAGDFTKKLERFLAIFREEKLNRAEAARFMDFLRRGINSDEGLPTWAIPAFIRVIKIFPNAAGLGKVTLEEKEQQKFRYLAGALSFVAQGVEESKVGEWIEAFEEGRARPYLLLAFAKYKIRKAVPVVMKTFREFAERVSPDLLLDYVLCLRTLTGKDFGTDADLWWNWYVKNKRTQ